MDPLNYAILLSYGLLIRIIRENIPMHIYYVHTIF